MSEGFCDYMSAMTAPLDIQDVFPNFLSNQCLQVLVSGVSPLHYIHFLKTKEKVFYKTLL